MRVDLYKFWVTDYNDAFILTKTVYMVLSFHGIAKGKTGWSEHTEICPWNTDNGHQAG